MDDGSTAAPASTQRTNEETARLMRWATYAAVSVASTLIVAKLAAWLATDSVSLLSTLMDSMLDVLASVVNLFAVRHALQPADSEHRFGHGKAEPLAALAQATFISGSAIFLILQAGERLLNPQPITNTGIGLAVMIFAIVMTFGLVIFQRYVVRRTGSVAVTADSLNYQADVLVNASVILSLLLASELGWDIADPLFALAIAGYILRNAWKIISSSLNLLMDRELPDEDREKMRRIALDHPEVRDVHDMRTRSSGSRLFVHLHMEMDPDMRLVDAHEVAMYVEDQIRLAYPHAEVIVHQDPEGVEEERFEFD